MQLGQFNGYSYTLTDNLNKILERAAKYLDQFAKNRYVAVGHEPDKYKNKYFICENDKVFVNKIQPILKEKMHESLQVEDHNFICTRAIKCAVKFVSGGSQFYMQSLGRLEKSVASAEVGSLPYINNDYHLRVSIT